MGHQKPPQLEDARMLSPEDTAKLLSVTPRALAQWRYRGTGPVFKRVGKYIRYMLTDIIKWQKTLPEVIPCRPVRPRRKLSEPRSELV